jgi:hypothetical protein
MIEDALRDPDWVLAMQEELNNFTRNEVWHLVPRPNQNVVGTKGLSGVTSSFISNRGSNTNSKPTHYESASSTLITTLHYITLLLTLCYATN